MGGVGELFAGAALGALLSEIVKDVKDKTMKFKELLRDLDSKIEALEPLKDIPKCKEVLEEVEKIVKQIVLILECYSRSRWKGFRRYKCVEQLLELDKRLDRLLTVLTVEGIRNGFKNMAVSRENLTVSKETLATVQKNGLVGNRENVVIQKQEGFHDLGSVPEPPYVTVGLDESLRDLKELLNCLATRKSLRRRAREFWHSRLADRSKGSILDSETELLRPQSSID